jgi:extracellular elastinolytic metalloproteinase
MARELDRRDFTTSAVTPGRQRELNDLAAGLSSEAGLLGVTLPPFVIGGVDPTTNNPSVVTFAPAPPDAGATGGLTAGGDRSQDLVGRALEVVGTIGGVLGLAPGQPAEFDADLSVQGATSGARTVHLEQKYKGIRVFQASRVVRFGPDGGLDALVGRTVTVGTDLDVAPKLSAQEAVTAAARFVAEPGGDAGDAEPERDEFGTPVPRPQVDLADFEPRVLARFLNRPDQPTLFDAGPFHDQIRANLVWFPLGVDELTLAWEVVLTLPGMVDQYRVLVNAANGEPLYARQLVQDLRAAASVFPVDGGRPRQTLDLPVPPESYGVPVPRDLPPGFPGDWADGDTTAGNTTIARYGDTDRLFQGRDAGGTVVFEAAAPNGQDQAVVNAFFLSCLMHDFYYLLGFREESGNFQQTNAGPLGAAGDRVDVRVYPTEIPRTASMFTPVDGSSPTLKLGLVSATGNHTAMDATVVAHEYTHGVTNRLVGGPRNVSALEAPQCRGMGEGWGDYVGCTVTGASVVGAWLVNRPGGIRGFPYDASFPAQTEHFGKLGTGRYTEEHNVGEIWCATLMEVNRRIGAGLAVQLVVDALKLSPANPSFLDMRDAILAALDFKARAGQVTPSDLPRLRDSIWQAFAKFGMGPNAACNGPFLAGIVADFTTPPQAGLLGAPGVLEATGEVHVASEPGQVLALPQDGAREVTSTLSVTDAGTVASLRVRVEVEHPAPEEVRITLHSPRGTAAVLHDATPDAAGLAREYASDDTPALAALAGEPGTGDWRLTVEDLAKDVEGQLRAWSLDLTLEPEAEGAPAPRDAKPAVAIPDNDPKGVESPIVLDDPGAAGRIEVEVAITHPEPADLQLTLVAPSGASAVLQAEGTAKGPNLSRTFASDSSEALGALLGEPIAGTWTLRVADVARKDTGTLDSWRLSVTAADGGAAGLTDGAAGVAALDEAARAGIRVTESGHDLRVAFGSPEAAEDFFQALRRVVAPGGGTGA